MKRRVVNNRPLCFAALALFIGLSVTGLLIDRVGGRVLCLAAAVIAIGLLLIFNKIKLIYIPMAFAAGIFLFSGIYGVYSGTVIEKKSDNITATIATEIIETEDGYYYFEVENISIDGEAVKHGATVYAYSLPEARAGEKIIIKGKIKSRAFEMTGGFVQNYRNGNYYTVSASDITSAGEGQLKFSTSVNVKLKRALYANTDDTTAEIVTALLFGDKYGIDSSLYDNVKSAGLAHIFTVSGLHIGTLAAAFYFLAKKLKIRGYARLFSVLAVLLLYGGICGFSASVVRAIIMSAVFMLADCTGRKKDNLNSLAFAAICIMVISPSDFYMVGFRMSFMSVLGLILLEKPIENRLPKRAPKKLNGIVAASVAVNIMLFPIMAEYFNSVQTLFVITNLLILPILPLIYIFTLLICLIVLVIPIAAPILVALSVAVWPIKLVSSLIGGLAISTLNVNGLGLLQVAYYAVIFLFTSYVFLTRREKGVIALNAVTLSVAATTIISLL